MRVAIISSRWKNSGGEGLDKKWGPRSPRPRPRTATASQVNGESLKQQPRGTDCTCGLKKSLIFDQYLALSRKLCKIGPWNPNRKS